MNRRFIQIEEPWSAIEQVLNGKHEGLSYNEYTILDPGLCFKTDTSSLANIKL